jgi:hypothetical protein
MRHVNAFFFSSSLILYAFHGVLDFKKICKKQCDITGLLCVNMLVLYDTHCQQEQ